jgi:hypothetical protein
MTDAWAKGALSLLIPAPAVPDMATQARCPKCQHLFSEGEIRYLRTVRPRGIKLIVLAVLVWAVYELLKQ